MTKEAQSPNDSGAEAHRSSFSHSLFLRASSFGFRHFRAGVAQWSRNATL